MKNRAVRLFVLSGVAALALFALAALLDRLLGLDLVDELAGLYDLLNKAMFREYRRERSARTPLRLIYSHSE